MLADIKMEIDTYFNDNWTGIVHFDGEEKPNNQSYIRLELAPIDRRANTSKRVFNTLQLQVSCYDTNPLKVMMLQDKVFAFFDCLTLTECISKTGEASIMGTVSIDNNQYMGKALFEVVSAF